MKTLHPSDPRFTPVLIDCPECDGTGERERNIEGMDCPVTCIFCEGSGKIVDDSEQEYEKE